MAPEGQAHWEEYKDRGVIYLSVMLEDSGGQAPGTEAAARWADKYELEHPVLADGTGAHYGYITTGYPTYVIVDQTMTIVEDDLWPFDMSYVDPLLEDAAE